MAISEDKKRVLFSLSEEDISKLKYLYAEDKKDADRRIYESDTLAKLISKAYKMKKGVKS